MGLKHRIAVIFLISALLFALPFYSKAAETDWQRNDLKVDKTLNSVCYGGGKFVAVGQGGAIFASSDGENWKDYTGLNADETGGADLNSVCYGKEVFVAVGMGKIITSTDGISWKSNEPGPEKFISISAVCFGRDTFIAFGSDKSCLISSDGITWSAAAMPPEHNISSACRYENGFVAVGDINMDYGTLYSAVSDNGSEWTEKFTEVYSSSCFLNSICRGGGNFVAVGDGGYILTTEDGNSWRTVECPEDGIFFHDYYGVCSDGAGTMVLVGKTIIGNTGLVRVSNDDGKNWSKGKEVDCLPRAVCFGDGMFVAVGESGIIITLASKYSVTINTYINGALEAAPGAVELRQGGITKETASSASKGVFTACVPNGTYALFINNEDTGLDITVKGSCVSASVSYYTVSFELNEEEGGSKGKISATANGETIASGMPVLSGKSVVISAEAEHCDFLWTGEGTEGQTTAEIVIPHLGGSVDAVCVLSYNAPNLGPSFTGSNSLAVSQNAAAAEIRDLLEVSDTDEGQTLKWSLITEPTGGTLLISGDTAASGSEGITAGSITYQADKGFAGEDSFTIEVSDGVDSAFCTIVVSVTPEALGAFKLSESSDTGASNFDNNTSAISLDFAGTSASGDTKSSVFVFIELDKDSGGVFNKGVDPYATATVNDGVWTVTGLDTSGISDGTYNVYAFTASSDGSRQSPLSAALEVVLDKTAPNVTDGNISISGASGADGKFIIGDTVTVTWNNTAKGDGNGDISKVEVDFTEFGGGVAEALNEGSDIWTASYEITKEGKGLNVSVTATDIAGNSALATDTSNATVETVSNTGGGQSGGGESGGVAVIAGEPRALAKTETSTNDKGQTTATATLYAVKLADILEAEGSDATVKVEIEGRFDVSETVLTGDMVWSMGEKGAVLSIHSDMAIYTLPASQLDIASISKLFDTEATPEDMKLTVKVERTTDDRAAALENAATHNGCSIVVPAVSFSVSCFCNGESVEISRFTDFVERMIPIPDGVNPEMITTGVVLDADGTIRHVPTRVTSIDGKYYAVIKSLTNSTYAAVSNTLEFSDVESHWAKDLINEMGSRLVINGAGDNRFEPERSITRAEYAAIVVRALGIAPKNGESGFSDVSLEDWYCGYVKTAVEYGIVNGFAEESFGPNDLVTREQAMAMISRAMKIASLKPCLTDSEIDAILERFKDEVELSAYAREGIAACVKAGVVNGTGPALLPNSNITRAEVAVMVWRMLRNTELI